MISTYQLKSGFQNKLRPMSNWLVLIGFTPNFVTNLTLVLNLLFVFWLAVTAGSPLALFSFPLVLFLRMALNAIDGMMAKEHGMVTAAGGLLNELSDLVADLAIYGAFFFVPGVNPYLIGIFLIVNVVVEFAGIAAVQIGSKRRFEGPMGKSDRAALFSVLALCLAFGLSHSWLIQGLLLIGVILGGVTTVVRVQKAIYDSKVNGKSV